MSTDVTNANDHRLDELVPTIARTARGFAAVGAVAGIVAAIMSETLRQRFFEAYLVNFAFFLSLSLGALCFVLLQHLTRSGWSVVIRRLAEGIAANVVVMALLFVPILIGAHSIYHWTHAEAVAHDPILQGKEPYLNVPFFTIRWIAYFAIWIGFSRYLRRRSIEQDASGDPALTSRMERASGPGMVLFAFTLTLGAFDLMMSVDPHWFSTIYGVYYFSGALVGLFGLLPLMVHWLQQRGRLVREINVEHYHDMGKLLFAFTVFWAYIAFSQYMLIWYANIPEETGWFLRRQSNGWTAITLVLLIGHFVVPFFALISRYPKRHRAALLAAAAWMLAMHWVDIYWLVRPDVRPTQPWPHWMDLACFLAIGGIYVEFLARRMAGASLIAERDPRLGESLAFESH